MKLIVGFATLFVALLTIVAVLSQLQSQAYSSVVFDRVSEVQNVHAPVNTLATSACTNCTYLHGAFMCGKCIPAQWNNTYVQVMPRTLNDTERIEIIDAFILSYKSKLTWLHFAWIKPFDDILYVILTVPSDKHVHPFTLFLLLVVFIVVHAVLRRLYDQYMLQINEEINRLDKIKHAEDDKSINGETVQPSDEGMRKRRSPSIAR